MLVQCLAAAAGGVSSATADLFRDKQLTCPGTKHSGRYWLHLLAVAFVTRQDLTSVTRLNKASHLCMYITLAQTGKGTLDQCRFFTKTLCAHSCNRRRVPDCIQLYTLPGRCQSVAVGSVSL